MAIGKAIYDNATTSLGRTILDKNIAILGIMGLSTVFALNNRGSTADLCVNIDGVSSQMPETEGGTRRGAVHECVV